MTKEGRPDLRALIDDTTTTAEFMQLFPSAKVPLEYLPPFVHAMQVLSAPRPRFAFTGAP